MTSISTLAQHTVIFLAPSNSEADAFMQYIASRKRSLSTQLQSPEWVLPEGPEVVLKSSILARPWFTDVWVLQELVLSGNPWVQRGSVRVR